jgi:hypothetical protein
MPRSEARTLTSQDCRLATAAFNKRLEIDLVLDAMETIRTMLEVVLTDRVSLGPRAPSA